VLAQQPGLLAIGANPGDTKRLLRADRERKRGAQDLSATFSR